REKANKYFDPFEEVVARVEDVVFMGEALGADLSNVYLLFAGGCHQWGLFTQGEKGIPTRILPPGEEVLMEFSKSDGGPRKDGLEVRCADKDTTMASKGGVFGRRRANPDAVDAEPLKDALSVVDRKNQCYCAAEEKKRETICILSIANDGSCERDTGNNIRINSLFTLCPVHANNINGEPDTSKKDKGICFEGAGSVDKDTISRRAGAIAREMYTQYNRLEIVTKQIRTMVQKAVLVAHDEAAGQAGGASMDRYTMCLGGDRVSSLECLINETSTLIQQVSGGTRPDTAMIEKCKVLMDRASAPKEDVQKCGTNPQTMVQGLAKLQSSLQDKVANEKRLDAAAGATRILAQ
ncbi:MAG: hypothetical protein LBG89_01905, partial [Rickettsiales bacterium]|nr:hypothetical protein [Rickettsiales bacterium]